MKSRGYLAIDLGASSGRVMLGTVADGQLALEEIHRFPNRPQEKGGEFFWDTDLLLSEIRIGLEKGVARTPMPESVGIDSWGVDYGLIGKNGGLIRQPHSYRDPRTRKSFAALTAGDLGRRIYDQTGIQLQPFNTLFQLHAEKKANPEVFSAISKLLFMPDLFNYFLTGNAATEFTYALTTQLYDPATRAWNSSLLNMIGVPAGIMQPIVSAGSEIGRLRPDRLPKCPALPVVAVGSHDTASAIAAIPAKGTDWAYISSGTWSLMGIECEEPVINDQSYRLNFTNEGSVDGRFRFLKNITGMWLFSECRRIWEPEHNLSLSDIPELIKDTRPFESFIDPDWQGFFNPHNMPEAITQYCKNTGQRVPQSKAQFVRCILESLAFKYRVVLDQLTSLTGKTIRVLHIVGGGSQNSVLNQFAANATGLTVMAGPAEATAIGNVLVQAIASGQVGNLEQARMLVRHSFRPKIYEPQDTAIWENALERFQNILASVQDAP